MGLLLGDRWVLQDAHPNDFAAYLSTIDRDTFLTDTDFPEALRTFTEQFRNPAMHAGELSADDCKAARDYLLSEPIRLLLVLVSAVR